MPIKRPLSFRVSSASYHCSEAPRLRKTTKPFTFAGLLTVSWLQGGTPDRTVQGPVEQRCHKFPTASLVLLHPPEHSLCISLFTGPSNGSRTVPRVSVGMGGGGGSWENLF